MAKMTMKGSGSNAVRKSINCAGYALGVQDWFDMDRYSKEIDDFDEIAHGLEVDFNLEYVGVMHHEDAEEYFKTEGGDLLLYRVSYNDEDFHFMNVTHRGRVYHKQGSYDAVTGGFKTIGAFNKYWKNYHILYDSYILVMKWTGPRGLK
jgi:hypothetical protein